MTNYEIYLQHELQDDEFADAYLAACFRDLLSEPCAGLAALVIQDVADARGWYIGIPYFRIANGKYPFQS